MSEKGARRWSDGQLIEAVQEVAERTSDRLTTTTYARERDDTHPTVSTLVWRFGSWSDVRQAADLAVRGATVDKYQTYSDSEILDALRDVQRRIGKRSLLSMAKYEMKRDDDMPSGQTVQRRFGGFAQARREAGIDHPDGRAFGDVYTDAEIREALRWADARDHPDHGRRLTQAKYEAVRDEADKQLPSGATIATRFGGWVAAREAADVAD